jgi:hypothetical protein
LGQQEFIGVVVKGFRIAKPHRILESRAFFVDGVGNVPEIRGELDGFLQGNDVIFDAVYIVRGTSVIRTAAAAEKGDGKSGDQQEGRQGRNAAPQELVHKISKF